MHRYLVFQAVHVASFGVHYNEKVLFIVHDSKIPARTENKTENYDGITLTITEPHMKLVPNVPGLPAYDRGSVEIGKTKLIFPKYVTSTTSHFVTLHRVTP